MDWRPTSRSRSRPPETTTFDQYGVQAGLDGRFSFPTSQDTFGLRRGGVSVPNNASMLSFGRRSPPIGSLLNHPTDLPSLYEEQGEHSNATYNNPFPGSPEFVPSSLPSSGFHGLSRIPSLPQNPPPPDEKRSFPRHVRKTSFDHTVYKDGLHPEIAGRHQVNGRPSSIDNGTGTKRRAEAPHYESMLRADPSNVEGSSRLTQELLDVTTSPFPSSAFNFSFPPYQDLFVPLSSSSTSPVSTRQNTLGPQSSAEQSPQVSTAFPIPHSSSGERLSAAAAAASAAMAESYAQLNAATLAATRTDEILDYNQILNLMYPGLDGNRQYVDPAQIFDHNSASVPSAYTSYHHSPSSDSWGNGPSSQASPEALPSSSSTPPPADGTRSTIQSRRYIPLKQDVLQRRASLNAGSSPTELRSSSSTPDLKHGEGKGSGEEADQPPTLCTNCHTTNTPLWRRDPEGQPLCKPCWSPCLFPKLKVYF